MNSSLDYNYHNRRSITVSYKGKLMKHREDYDFLLEREKLRNNLDALKRSAANFLILHQDLEKILREAVLTQRDSRLLRIEISRTLEEFNIQMTN